MRKSVVLLLVVFLISSISMARKPDISGYLKVRYNADQSESHGFEMYEAIIQNNWDLSENVSGNIDFYLYPERVPEISVESMYGLFKDFPELGPSASGTLLVGKAWNYCFGIVPAYANRKTADYSMVSNYLTRARVTGAQYFLDYNQVKVNFGVFNGHQLNTMMFGSQGQFFVLDELAAEENKNKEVSIRFAFVADNTEIGFSGASAKITAAELAVLNASAGTAFTSDSRSQYGIDFMYNDDKNILSGQIFSASVSGVDSMAYEFLGGLELEKTDLFLRFSYLTYDNINESAVLTSSWNKTQITPSVRYRFRKDFWLQVEANLNGEDEPARADALDNSELFAELHIGF